MFERFTDDARKAMALTNQEAQRYNHEYIGTEHLLIGLMKEGGTAAQILIRRGYNLDQIIVEVERRVKPGDNLHSMGRLPQTPRTKQVVEHAIEYARTRGDKEIRTEHLLYGILDDPSSIGCQILTELGFDKQTLEAILGEGQTTRQGVAVETKVPAYWMVPRDKMDLAQVLSCYGYLIQEDKRGIETRIPVKSGNSWVGEVEQDTPDINRYNKAKVTYAVDPVSTDQIGEALNFRVVLDSIKADYTESPSALESAQHLRSATTPLRTQINMLESLAIRLSDKKQE